MCLSTCMHCKPSCAAQGLPELGVPELPSFLKPPKTFRSATFDVTYLDQSMRITRGDRWVGAAPDRLAALSPV